MRNKVRSIYKNREEFIVIGLTGKTGSGCSTVADILKNGYKEYNPVDCNLTDIQSRKAEIIKKFASKNFIDDDKKFKIIKPSTILIMLFLFDNKIIIEKITSLFESLDKKEENLKKEIIELKEIKKIAEILNKDVEVFKEFFKFIDLIDIENSKNQEDDILKEIKKVKELYERKLKLESKEDLEKEIKTILGTKNNIKLKKYRLDFKEYKTIDENSTDKKMIKDKIDLKRAIFNDFIKKYSKINSKRFIKLYTRSNEKIQKLREEKKLSTKDLQLIGDLVREYVDIYQLPNYCNYLIKAYRNESKNKSCYIAIDSLKNPFEIVFFKERYSAYYTFSIHSKDETIEKRLKDLGYNSQEIEGIHKKEQNVDEKDKQKGSLDSSKDFNSQNITECIQRSDIYIDNNQDKKDTLYRQIFRYLSLIVHPGLITPSKDELIMQIALNAKFNSGCISRQVGAVVLNKHGSVKSIGWNEVPEGQLSCLLRSHSELLNNSTLNFYSKYEKSDFKSKDSFKYIFSTTKQPQYKESDKLGLNDSFCFKSIQNEIDGQKNQVYTRSLHAEENAFLQASKYGNSEIIGGQLFTTASPCFLCAKKAYQLGIKRVVYIEAYPDISNEQVFEIGSHDIEVVHFRGATGLAYQKLYEPIFSYKDELKALNKKEKRV
ncbi:deaminase [Aliarcobacter butzleri]|uniref:Deaminase n=1 Tax=Aliarcobacter butzleri TaxID=28197 RepID=A0AAW7Q9K0_9BACT|nr:deaminase [Aliarcobacter butzleri]MDN5108031.1 deaminase [Aliarcobacter butzleri]MDN5122763.1 deaminase [Aliarcobacter butzleri]